MFERLSTRNATIRVAAVLGMFACLVGVPLYAPSFWLLALLLASATAIAALGLNLLSGQAGQLSLGHAAFVGIAAYSYVYFAADEAGLGLPPLVAAVMAVVLTGAVGAAFSPLSSRLAGIYLGVASLGLVFIMQYVLLNGQEVTGGALGRAVPPLSIAGFTFADGPDQPVVLGVPFGRLELLWFIAFPTVGLAYMAARRISDSKTGRAFRTIRDSEVAARCSGINVGAYKGLAFLVSSVFAGVAGVITAVVFGYIVPDYFDLALSIQFLVMIVLGGMGSNVGAVVGAFAVTLLPQVLTTFSDTFGLGESSGSGPTPQSISQVLFGLCIVLILLFRPEGFSTFIRRRTLMQSVERSDQDRDAFSTMT